ncbi:MAG: DNA polymerase III subunit chi [Gemmobacter sp.]
MTAGVRFYHLTRLAPTAVVTQLAERALGQGWRVALRTPSAERAAWWDAALWLGAEDGFFAHGRAGGPHDADQPVLVVTDAGRPANGARYLVGLDGAAIEPGDLAAYERVSVLFDGNDPAQVEVARGQWRRLTGAGARAEYWAEESGRWVRKAEAGGER